jgi:hypothetical protein
MFGFGFGEILLVAGIVAFALISGRNVSGMAQQAGKMAGLWFKIKQKLSLLRFLK